MYDVYAASEPHSWADNNAREQGPITTAGQLGNEQKVIVTLTPSNRLAYRVPF